jgi:hypothetical protein
MQRALSLYLRRLVGLDPPGARRIASSLVRYSKERRFGFVDTTMDDAVVESVLVYQTTMVQRVFDPSTNKLAVQHYETYERAPFWLDTTRALLMSVSCWRPET